MKSELFLSLLSQAYDSPGRVQASYRPLLQKSSATTAETQPTVEVQQRSRTAGWAWIMKGT